MRLDLHKVCLIFVVTRAHELSQIALDDILSKAEFGHILIYTDNPESIKAADPFELRHAPNFPNKKLAGQFYYAEVAKDIPEKTPFALFLEWDAGIFDTANWRPEFLTYDYIGAPWLTSDDMKVGNGGFTIMSRRFSQWLVANRLKYPCATDWDVCRTQRPRIEALGLGFEWAPFDLAHDFAWELINPRSPNTFGYHGIFNWPDMIGKDETVRRVQLMAKDPYLLTKMEPVFRKANWLPEALGAETFEKFLEINPQHVTRYRPRHLSQPFRGMDQRAQLLAATRRLALNHGGQKA